MGTEQAPDPGKHGTGTTNHPERVQLYMLLSYLLKETPGVISVLAHDVRVSSPVTEDHRAIEPGGLFVAKKGQTRDGHSFIADAVQAGAVAVVGERAPGQVNCPVPYAQVASAEQAIGWLAAAYHGFPSRSLVVVGVTGTDGKTTTSTLIYHMLRAAGLRAGMITTVSAVIGDETLDTGLHTTTPAAPDIQRYLRRMVKSGLTHCVLETTSHGLAQGRVNGVDYDIAVLTNVTHEHLDYHGSFENYRAAKGLLFENLVTSYRKPTTDKCAIINGDDPNASFFLQYDADRRLVYSLNHRSGADITPQSWLPSPRGMVLRVVLAGASSILVETSLIGAYNRSNIMAAVGAAFVLGCEPDAITAGVAETPPVPGRMERISMGQSFSAIVDFAHTPNALQAALETARTLTEGRVIAVFGSAGLRDVEKRRLMAEVSTRLADVSVFTAEDPRTEPLEAILEAMAEGAVSQGGIEGKTFHCIPDRGKALLFACALARSGDVVIACGKGHEQSMCFGTIEYPWDDRDAIRAALRGSPLRTLPTAHLD